MTIDKAIIILIDYNHALLSIASPDIIDAQKLGIEALKRDQDNRRINNHPDQSLLPGETLKK